MIKNFLRAFLFIFIFFIFFIDINISIFFNKSSNQLLIGIIILIILLFVDPIIGFLLGIIFLIIYFKYYLKIYDTKKIQLTNFVDDYNKNKEDKKDNIIKLNYISPELLIAAQSNIVDENNYNNEIKGFDNKLYGIQGLNYDKLHYNGYDSRDIYNTL